MTDDLNWQQRYEENDTPWDQGIAAPALEAYLLENSISGRVLIPGCGRGHEARALARRKDVSVLGLDLSPTAITRARQLSSPVGPDSTLDFQVGDFLQDPGSLAASFDWLIEHTCFCALEPRQRPAYVRAAAAYLKPGGKIFGIFYLDPDTEQGPPFRVTWAELEELFSPHFEVQASWVPQVSFPGRENRELVTLLQKR